VVDGYTLGIDQGTGHQVTLVCYPETAKEPISCTNNITAFTTKQLKISCTGYTSGTSGTPWLIDDGSDDRGQVRLGQTGKIPHGLAQACRGMST
jgi:hypothetical protein